MRHRFPTPLRSLRGSRGYERNRDRPQLGTTATRNLVVKLHIERMVPGFHVVGKITVCSLKVVIRRLRSKSPTMSVIAILRQLELPLVAFGMNWWDN